MFFRKQEGVAPTDYILKKNKKVLTNRNKKRMEKNLKDYKLIATINAYEVYCFLLLLE
jgi:hypothetical protein